MGNGLTESRKQSPLDAITVSILERLFQAGVQKSSRRKGVLEMAEECQKELPSLLAPDELAIGSWLSSRVEREKKSSSRVETSSEDGSKVPKTDFIRRQEVAAVLSKDAKAMCEENSEVARQTFETLYQGIVLEVSEDDDDDDDDDNDGEDSETEIRIVTSVFFHEGSKGVKKGWYVSTDLACEAEECMHSAQKYSSADLGQELDIKIASGSARYPGLGTYIKLFNENEKIRVAFNIDD